jgi:hypothetical protein
MKHAKYNWNMKRKQSHTEHGATSASELGAITKWGANTVCTNLVSC